MSYENILTKNQIIQSENNFNKNNPKKSLLDHAVLGLWKKINKQIKKKKILFICGPGNNGEDGRRLHKLLLGHGKKKLNIINLCKNPKTNIKKEIQKKVNESNIIIDAIFGLGLNRDVNDFYINIFKIINASLKRIFSIDIPSGLYSDSGRHSTISINADKTFAIGFYKPCHFLMPSKSFCGKIYLVKINLKKPKKMIPKIYHLNEKEIKKKIPKHNENIHKYHKGNVLVIGGKMAGASRLVSLSARKVGAGLATINIDKKLIKFYSGVEPGTIIDQSKNICLEKFNVIVIGPGLGIKHSKSKIVDFLKSKNNIILDADALTAFKDDKEIIYKLLRERKNTILTPHEGEFKRFFDISKGSKIDKALKAASLTSSIIIYKGNDTVIAFPNGKIWINCNAKNNLATAGSGDVLAGIIAGFVAQTKNMKVSSLLAVWLHGKLSNNCDNVIAEDFIYDIPIVLIKEITNIRRNII